MFHEYNKAKITAILGPTNTGKTYLALDRLLSYKSGVFGFPLRLLARENYDKAVFKVGSNKVALITGEEKIIPSNPKYFFCTVESMPYNINSECVAIDEVQLASDFERGHIFTDRILNFRGKYETILLGSKTIKNILIKIIKDIKIETRERFSKLTFSKKYNISKVKPRSAIIAFNVNKVYELAEMVRSLKGGAAVVLGSLSPRTRNAQVEIYENNEVDYLIATDAIGMGLNLNINHVIFSSLKKFDGRYTRKLFTSEIAQIAGRAGRYMNDGTFGFTKDIYNVDPIVIKNVEEHNFEDIQKVYWRNNNLDFSSISSFLDSLNKDPFEKFYIKKRNAQDELSFRQLKNDSDIKKYLNNPENLKILWEVCRIPDFPKILNDSYIELLKDIFLKLIKNNLTLPESLIYEHVYKIENFKGDIEALAKKIAYIRTWTYISNQHNWLKNKNYWQEKTRNIENNLSDQLHEKLTNRFIDNSAIYFSKNNKVNLKPIIEIEKQNTVKLNTDIYGRIKGFRLIIENKIKSLSNFSHEHVKKSVKLMILEKIKIFLEAPEDSISLEDLNSYQIKEKIKIFWGEDSIAYLKKGQNIYSPKIEIRESESIDSENKKLIINKLEKWITNKISEDLNSINIIKKEDLLNANIRSITFNLFDNLGSMPIYNYYNQIKKLTKDEKLIISKLGIRIGAKFFFMPNLLKKSAIELKAILWNIYNNPSLDGKLPIPQNGRVSFKYELNMPQSYWMALGYLSINNFAIRIDSFEKIFFLARQKIKTGPFLESSELMNPLGCNSQQLSEIMEFCGFQSILMGNEKRLFSHKNKKANQNKNHKIKKNFKKIVKPKIDKKRADPNSPFAVLQKLL
ncbi:MAG: hypothetical protein CFH19_00076 [Alphaproteobacteria bacterium MarineAlpha5_Bin9]|nr:MAG: hypothetical protein CFH19_00076 [Alphaproteobacteria bacterium MarineAlpha5_Bin9]|tara:strand:- start:12064 stop:14622 length:2559 start_codon:yes stop_codon:yes gene_type:complete